MRFTKVKEDVFKHLQLNAGILCKKFNPSTLEVLDEDIISATKGGVSASCTPTYRDLGADIDNCPKNTKELKDIESIECKLEATLVGATEETIKLMLGTADIAGGVVTPRNTVKQEDFIDLWWVGDRSDGGMCAIKIMNALSDSGFSLKTTDKGNGEFALSVVGHSSILAPSIVPMEFYLSEPKETTRKGKGE